MIIDKNSINSASFSFYTNKELEQQDCIKQIDFILEKYNILENDNQLISSIEKNILYTINYIETLFIKKEKIPEDLEDLFLKNLTFKENINFYIEKKIFNIRKKDSIYFFKDINIILHILSIGTNQKILESYNNYDFDALSNIFRFYETKLQELFSKDEKLFSLTFDSYILLLKTITLICSFNAIDFIEKKSIQFFIDLMTESINIIKFTILLDKNKLNKLNNIQGKYLYYFSYDDIKIDINNLKTTFKKYLLVLERYEDGYILSKDSNFGNENIDSFEFLIFKKNCSVLILTLIKDLKSNLDENLYFDSEYFQKILRFYYKNFSLYLPSEVIATNLEEFQNNLLNSLLTTYEVHKDFMKKLDYNSVINDFIFSQDNLTSTNIEIIFQLLYFDENIPIYKYYHIAQILTQYNPIKNDYHEYFKLAIFDLCINKSIKYKYNSEIEDVLTKIHAYVNDYKIASHLLCIYSKIYLSISLFYSTNQIDLEKAKKLYATFIQINGLEILLNEYNELNSKILNNIQLSTDLILDEFLKTKHKSLENEFSIIKNKIKQTTLIDEIKSSLESFISNNIFHGLCQTEIFETTQELTTLETGFEDHQLILSRYTIRFIFTTIYKASFLLVLEENEVFIRENIYKVLDNFKEKDTKYNLLINEDDEINIKY
ncbi:hypothetical protein [Arcobacter caeni]|uniref:Uncharacterized protein n=1 Tax=Arcobacter caeni TaxID=1912877 RepID=A0A363D3I3_9BACT|nr:hypothetical protein [Arcobacter caeni]PUE65864.1 hypothetical protein B0174_03290 [Arcobacter caeni]